MNLDIFQFIFNLSGQSTWLDALGTFLASYLSYFLVLGFLFFLYRQAGWSRRVFLTAKVALAVILSRGLIVEIVRFFYPLPRPFEVLPIDPLILKTSAAFPSGHMATYFALALVLYFADRRWGWLYMALALVVGIARIFVGVHWPADIIGGIVVGLLSALFVHRLLLPYSRQFSVMEKDGDAKTQSG